MFQMRFEEDDGLSNCLVSSKRRGLDKPNVNYVKM